MAGKEQRLIYMYNRHLLTFISLHISLIIKIRRELISAFGGVIKGCAHYLN
jgi:hypothetical protein